MQKVDAVAKNASTSPYGNVISLTESPLAEGLLYAGTDDGEAFGGFPIAARLDENIDHVTILVNGAPEKLSFASDRDEHLVQVPRIAEATLPTLQRSSVFRAELEAPKPDRLVGNRDAALGEKVFYIPKAETEAVVEPNGMTDDFCWKSVSTVARRVAFHRPSLPDTAST